jgi:hypothetical protein
MSIFSSSTRNSTEEATVMTRSHESMLIALVANNACMGLAYVNVSCITINKPMAYSTYIPILVRFIQV